jgi:heterodisulfide reductase subunit C
MQEDLGLCPVPPSRALPLQHHWAAGDADARGPSSTAWSRPKRRPFSRVMLKLISTGNQLSPDMINAEGFPDWGPNISKVNAPLKVLRKAIPMPTLNTTETAWEVNLTTSVELYTIWEESGVLKQLETIDENLYDVILDIMDEKREDLADWKDSQDDQDDD